MKKFKNMFFMIIGFVIAGMIGAKASTLISSNQVIYKDDKTVSEALDELIEKSNNINENLRYDEETGYIQVMNLEGDFVNLYKTEQIPIDSTSLFDGTIYKDGIINTDYWDGTYTLGGYANIAKNTDNYYIKTNYTTASSWTATFGTFTMEINDLSEVINRFKTLNIKVTLYSTYPTSGSFGSSVNIYDDNSVQLYTTGSVQGGSSLNGIEQTISLPLESLTGPTTIYIEQYGYSNSQGGGWPAEAYIHDIWLD